MEKHVNGSIGHHGNLNTVEFNVAGTDIGITDVPLTGNDCDVCFITLLTVNRM